jgi:hypothetical protein
MIKRYKIWSEYLIVDTRIRFTHKDYYNNYYLLFIVFLALQPSAGYGLLIYEVS